MYKKFLGLLQIPLPFFAATQQPQRAYAPCPRLTNIWLELAQCYFPACPHLREYTLCWSPRRQRRVLGSCNLRRKVVKVAQELRPPEYQAMLEPLLFHEMCHAVIGLAVARKGGKRAWHGSAFKALEARHPQIPTLDAWIKNGGWAHAVRSHRGRQAARRATR